MISMETRMASMPKKGSSQSFMKPMMVGPSPNPPRFMTKSTPAAAMARMRTALSEIVIEGIETNVPLHEALVRDAAFLEGGTNIHYLENKLGL